MASKRIGVVLPVMCMAIAVLPLAANENYIILRNGQRQNVESIRYQRSTREYIVVAERSTIPIPEAQVIEVVVSKPAQWDAGEAALQSQRYEDAIRVFRDIVNNYEKLRWDNRARLPLAQAYAGSGEHARAITVYDELFSAITPTAPMRRAYWDSLLAAERFSTLKVEVENAIAGEDPAQAAIAHLMRGQVHAAEGNPTEAFFDYMRTHILFENVRSPQMHAEALYRAAGRLESLRDPRAAELRNRLRQLYPDSEFARRAP